MKDAFGRAGSARAVNDVERIVQGYRCRGRLIRHISQPLIECLTILPGIQANHILRRQLQGLADPGPERLVFAGYKQEPRGAIPDHQGQGLAAGHTRKRHHAAACRESAEIEGDVLPGIFR